MVIDHDPAPLADVEAARTGQFVAGTNTRGDDDHPDVERLAVVEHHPLDFAVANDLLGRGIDVNLNAERLDLFDEKLGAGAIHLAGHQSRHELDHVCVEAEIVRSLGRLETEQSAANDGRILDLLGVCHDRLEVFDRPIDEDPFLVDARNWWNEGSGACRKHNNVVTNLLALLRSHDASFAVDAGGLVADVK